MERTEGRFIELQGRFVAVLYKDNDNMAVLFQDEQHGKLNLIIPYQCMLYHNFDRSKAYKLLADLRGHTRQSPNGKTFTKNNLTVKRVLQ